MSLEQIPYLGEMLALLAPLSWAFAVILFRWAGEEVPPFTLNLFKNGLGLLLGVVTILALGTPLFQPAPWQDYAILIGAGAIGIGISDLLFFMALNRVGASLWSIINTAYSPSIILLAVLFLGERLAPVQWAGVALILGAVGSVSVMQGTKKGVAEIAEHVKVIPRATLLAGIGLGLAAMLTQAVSVVMVKPLLERTDLIWNYVWRIFGGLGFMLVVWPFLPQRREIGRAFGRTRDLLRMLPGSAIGTYISLMLWLGGMKYAKASVASVLNQTATLFIFTLAVLILKEPLTWKRVVGLAVGLAGVALVTFGG